MLEPLAAATGVGRHLDAILSVDGAGIYKPSPRVYQLVVDHLTLLPTRIGFVSANAWDAIGAKAFGFTSFWINRNQAPMDRHGPKPDAVLSSLSELPPLLGNV
jgi:2-haloacid dehalogenase